jgi:hypothetical protein
LRLTSSSPSRDEDSFGKTAMSRREDIVSCIDVTIMDRFAHRALPSPYSKNFPAFGAGAAITPAAGLGGKRFIDFGKPHACVSAFVQQHGSKCAPARIEHRLGQLGLWWQSLITERGKRAQPQIDSHTRHRAIEDRADRRFISLLRPCAGHTDIQIPASAAVFTEIARPQLDASETVAVPQRQPPSREVDLSASIANRSDLERNPTQGPACTATLAPGEADFSTLAPPPRVFFGDLLYRLDGKMQSAVAARGPF